ncbi:MAG: TraR/DksA family transcriptional regulator [Granulosicoccaceae bacterium]
MSHYSEKELMLHKENINNQLTILESLEETARDAAQTVTLDQSRIGRLSRMDALQGQAMANAAVERRQLEVVQLRNALKRIDDGSFGECLACFEDIDPRRVTHNPAVSLCLNCAAALEKRS